MSDDNDRVGFGKPPKAHRFQKGAPSPNPAGRPRKRKNDDLGMIIITDFGKELLEESRRTITIQTPEGSTEVTQRSLLVRRLFQAAHNNPKVLLSLISILPEIEKEETLQKFDEIGSALEYKEKMEAYLRECAESGTEPREIVPHPADMEIDMTGVRYLGARTNAEKKVQDQVVAQRDRVIGEIETRASLGELYDLTPDSLEYSRALVKCLGDLNRQLPPRLHRWCQLEPLDSANAPDDAMYSGLKNPGVREGASLAGGDASENSSFRSDDTGPDPAATAGSGIGEASGTLTGGQREVMSDRDLLITEIELGKNFDELGAAERKQRLEEMAKIELLNALLPSHFRRRCILRTDVKGDLPELVARRDKVLAEGHRLILLRRTDYQSNRFQHLVSELRAINANLPTDLRGYWKT